MKHNRITSALLFCNITISPVADALNSATIIASAASPGCIEYRVEGLCYWLLCTLSGCSVKTSIRVRHYLPNVVVSAYAHPGGNPWTEVSLLGVIGTSGGNSEPKLEGRKNNLRYKNADAIGHPAQAALISGLPGYRCQSPATPFLPYFLTALDSVIWRSGIPESFFPEALIPGQREIGSTLSGNMWGAIFPRTGFVIQVDDYKAAAIIAQRVADIITRSGQPHIYKTLTTGASAGYWPPGPVTENTGTKNHKWQRLSPSMSSSCTVFPDSGGQVAQDGNYAWALWQPYSCCQRMGQIFLSSSHF